MAIETRDSKEQLTTSGEMQPFDSGQLMPSCWYRCRWQASDKYTAERQDGEFVCDHHITQRIKQPKIPCIYYESTSLFSA